MDITLNLNESQSAGLAYATSKINATKASGEAPETTQEYAQRIFGTVCGSYYQEAVEAKIAELRPLGENIAKATPQVQGQIAPLIAEAKTLLGME